MVDIDYYKCVMKNAVVGGLVGASTTSLIYNILLYQGLIVEIQQVDTRQSTILGFIGGFVTGFYDGKNSCSQQLI